VIESTSCNSQHVQPMQNRADSGVSYAEVPTPANNWLTRLDKLACEMLSNLFKTRTFRSGGSEGECEENRRGPGIASGDAGYRT
jgi:hypothetical protein